MARKRSFFTFHSKRMYLALPTPKPIPQNQAPGCIYDFLLPVQQVPRWTLLAGTFTATASNVGDTDPYKPRTGGYLYFNEKRAVIQGALVRIEAPLARSRDVDPLSWWRLLRKSVNGFELLLADRKRPLKVNLLSQDQIVEVRSEKIPVASPGHPLISFRAWGEPPLGPCSAVRDDRLDERFPENAPVVRILTPKELFQAMDPERGAEEHDLLLAAGTSRGELYSLVGESIAKRMTDAVAERTQQELSSFDHLVATGRADPNPPAQPAQHWVTVAAEEFATIKEAWERTSPTPSPSPPLVECASRAGGYGTPPPRALACSGSPTTQNGREQNRLSGGTSTVEPLRTTNMCTSTRYWLRLIGAMIAKKGTSRWWEPQWYCLVSLLPRTLPGLWPLLFQNHALRTSPPPCGWRSPNCRCQSHRRPGRPGRPFPHRTSVSLRSQTRTQLANEEPWVYFCTA